MKKTLCIVILIILYGCPAYDPARGLLYIENNSDEAIYVYLRCGKVDSLLLTPKLELFEFFNNDDMSMRDASGAPLKSKFVSPEYRINAYQIGSITIQGKRSRPRLPCDENEISLFFITEKTMHDYQWEIIYENQIFVKKVTLTKDYLDKNNWIYNYSLDDM